MLNWWRMATETLSESWEAASSERRKPYLQKDNQNHQTWKIPMKNEKQRWYADENCYWVWCASNPKNYLLANFWWDILVGKPDLEIRTTSRTPQHLNCCSTRPCSYFPGDWKLLGLIQRMKCGVVLSRRFINWKSWPCEEGISTLNYLKWMNLVISTQITNL